MLEFGGMITVRFICDRGVSHELVRHRVASFAQECVSGDTEIHKGITIKQLYDRKDTQYGKTHNKTIWLKSMNENGEIIPNKIKEIFYKGKQEVYELITRNGYKIKCTLNHEFFTETGFKKLRILAPGDDIYVNGRPCLVKIPIEQIKKMYLEDGLTIKEIANICGTKESSISRILHALKIFKSHLNDKNKEKYNKNHTIESYKKMQNSIIEQYKNGRIVWNKGLLENDCESVKKQGDTLRKYHHDNGQSKNNSNWKNGNSIYRKLKNDIIECECCNGKNRKKISDRLEVHHVDRNRKNNDIQNLSKLCKISVTKFT